jgi:chromate transporter
MTGSVNVQRLREVGMLFLRLGLTAFGGPAAHVALVERECVERRRWIPREEFLDLLGASSLIPGPTSTELVMHIGRRRAGWGGLVVAGLAFIVPAAVLVGALAAIYVEAGRLPAMQGVLAAVQPVVVVIVVQALAPLARGAIKSIPIGMLALATGVLAAAGVPELRLLVLAGVAHVAVSWRRLATLVLIAGAATVVLGQEIVARADTRDVFLYFARIGSLLFGSGYVLLPVLEGDLVERLRWLTDRQLLDAIAAGQATPGPVFSTATFIGYLLGGPWAAAAATVGIFLPAFVFSAISSTLLHRLRASRVARAFLDGVNAAAVALIAVVAVTLARTAFTGPASFVIAAAAAGALMMRVPIPAVLLAAAVLGAFAMS